MRLSVRGASDVKAFTFKTHAPSLGRKYRVLTYNPPRRPIHDSAQSRTTVRAAKAVDSKSVDFLAHAAERLVFGILRICRSMGDEIEVRAGKQEKTPRVRRGGKR